MHQIRKSSGIVAASSGAAVESIVVHGMGVVDCNYVVDGIDVDGLLYRNYD